MSPLKIERMYAFVAQDADGNEGVCGFQMPDGQWFPLVGADEARVDSLREMAQAIATATGKSLKLCLFEQRVEKEVVQP